MLLFSFLTVLVYISQVDYKCKTIKKNATCPATLFLVLKRHPEFGERKSRSGVKRFKDMSEFNDTSTL